MRARGMWKNIKRKDIYLTRCKNIEKHAKQERKEIFKYAHGLVLMKNKFLSSPEPGMGKKRGWFAAIEMQNGKNPVEKIITWKTKTAA